MQRQHQPSADPEESTPGQDRDVRRRDQDERAEAAISRSVAVHEDRAATALSLADAARGRSYEAADRGNPGLAEVEWAAAHGLDGEAAEELAVALRARAAAARAVSVTVATQPPVRVGPQAAPAAPGSTTRVPVPGRTR